MAAVSSSQPADTRSPAALLHNQSSSALPRTGRPQDEAAAASAAAAQTVAAAASHLSASLPASSPTTTQTPSPLQHSDQALLPSRPPSSSSSSRHPDPSSRRLSSLSGPSFDYQIRRPSIDSRYQYHQSQHHSPHHYYHYHHHHQSQHPHHHHDVPSRPPSALLRYGSAAAVGPSDTGRYSPSLAGSPPYPRRSSQTSSIPSVYLSSEHGGPASPLPRHSSRFASTTPPLPPHHHHSFGQANHFTYPVVIEKPPSRGSSAVQSVRSSSQHAASRRSASPSDDSPDEHLLSFKETVKALVHLSFTALPLSIALLFYTLLVLIYSSLTWPLSLCIKSQHSPRVRLFKRLIPPLNLQYRCICFPAIPIPSVRSSTSSQAPLSTVEKQLPHLTHFEDGSIAPIIAVHVLSPFVALPLAFCAFAMGLAWGLGGIVSDESAGDVRDERRFAEKVIAVWLNWLDRGRDGILGQDLNPPQRLGRSGTREAHPHGPPTAV